MQDLHAGFKHWLVKFCKRTLRLRESDGTVLFFFPCAAGRLSIEDKEVIFQLRTGPLELKTKFPLKEMMYRGKLSL